MKKAPKKFVFRNKWWLKWQFLFCVFGVLVGLFGLKVGFFSTLVYVIFMYGGRNNQCASTRANISEKSNLDESHNMPTELYQTRLSNNDVFSYDSERTSSGLYTDDGYDIGTGKYDMMYDNKLSRNDGGF
ncbi:hypothetical protein [Piscirickettsia litoralis]|uniref:Uncharacterized protein n=1 Tax=Piscirickettsia litoralis TaxID=1891921 RepID=A0ABX2ZXM4_9GAMM|nr:hypothetical protein [Piscirickettsia litoralis]ODN41351.1 hypothetical protein BGC07_16400 [Piscirickettsia litoralis]